MTHPEIPHGYYCYHREGRIVFDDPNKKTHGTFQIVRAKCPHWGRNPDYHHQENGYCTLFDIKDWEDGTLLWDQVKECDENLETDDED